MVAELRDTRIRGFAIKQKPEDLFKRSYRSSTTPSYLNLSVQPGTASVGELMIEAPQGSVYVQDIADIQKVDAYTVVLTVSMAYRVLGDSIANPVYPFQLRMYLPDLFSQRTIIGKTPIATPSNSHFGAFYVPRVLVYLRN